MKRGRVAWLAIRPCEVDCQHDVNPYSGSKIFEESWLLRDEIVLKFEYSGHFASVVRVFELPGLFATTFDFFESDLALPDWFYFFVVYMDDFDDDRVLGVVVGKGLEIGVDGTPVREEISFDDL